MEAPKSARKNRLTLYIMIALFLGIGLGFTLNQTYLADENATLPVLDSQLQSLKTQIARETDSVKIESLTVARSKISTQRNQLLESRDKKVEGFSLLADIFLRLIKMIVAPLVFSTLVVGVAKLGDINSVGRIGGKTLLWFVGASLISLLLGLVMVTLFKPGVAMNLPLPDVTEDSGLVKTGFTLKNFLYHMFPSSIVESMAKNEILQIVVFSVFFGIATAAIGEPGKIVIKAMDAIAHVILKLTGYVMNAAPIAVFGAMTAIIAKQGLSILGTYSLFIGEFYFSLLLLWLILIFAGFLVIGKSVVTLLRRVEDPILLAFSTASSEAAFPKTMEELERFGCNNRIVSFVLPLGYSFNLDGSMMYMTFASMFIAQSYGIDLPLGTQLSMLLVLMVTSKGIAGVPRASLVVIAGTLVSFNIPEAGLALLLGIDPLLDMGRSATNVVGNSIATAVVSKWEKGLNRNTD
jgi:Na+/H+-dicarboxylate symporter